MAKGKGTPRKGIDDSYGPTSPSSPSPSSGTPPRRTNSASALSSPAPRGPLPTTSETSYHKRLRALLLDHKRCRKEWNELVIRGCLSRTRAALELWTDIEYVRRLSLAFHQLAHSYLLQERAQSDQSQGRASFGDSGWLPLCPKRATERAAGYHQRCGSFPGELVMWAAYFGPY